MITSDPHAEVKIDEGLVRDLVRDQFPEFADLEVRFMDAGWDNENYQLGSEYLVRIPRRSVAVDLLVNESMWLPKLKDQLPINIPAPIGFGQPGMGYPWVWNIVPWFSGETADSGLLHDEESLRLIDFLKILHDQNAEGAPINKVRGIPLMEKNTDVKARLERLRKSVDLDFDRIESIWNEAVNITFPNIHKLMHGDLHPRNVLVDSGRLSAIIDWGDITSGDAAGDLSSLWMLFKEKDVREKALQAYRASEALSMRAVGWAIFFGVILLDTGLVSNERHARIGRFTLNNVLNDDRI